MLLSMYTCWLAFFLWVANGHPRCELKDLVLLPIDFLLARSPACMVCVCVECAAPQQSSVTHKPLAASQQCWHIVQVLITSSLEQHAVPQRLWNGLRPNHDVLGFNSKEKVQNKEEWIAIAKNWRGVWCKGKLNEFVFGAMCVWVCMKTSLAVKAALFDSTDSTARAARDLLPRFSQLN